MRNHIVIDVKELIDKWARKRYIICCPVIGFNGNTKRSANREDSWLTVWHSLARELTKSKNPHRFKDTQNNTIDDTQIIHFSIGRFGESWCLLWCRNDQKILSLSAFGWHLVAKMGTEWVIVWISRRHRAAETFEWLKIGWVRSRK